MKFSMKKDDVTREARVRGEGGGGVRNEEVRGLEG